MVQKFWWSQRRLKEDISVWRQCSVWEKSNASFDFINTNDLLFLSGCLIKHWFNCLQFATNKHFLQRLYHRALLISFSHCKVECIIYKIRKCQKLYIFLFSAFSPVWKTKSLKLAHIQPIKVGCKWTLSLTLLIQINVDILLWPSFWRMTCLLCLSVLLSFETQFICTLQPKLFTNHPNHWIEVFH